MQKRVVKKQSVVGKRFFKNAALSEIFMLVLMSVSIAFIIGQSMPSVVAADTYVGRDESGGYLYKRADGTQYYGEAPKTLTTTNTPTGSSRMTTAQISDKLGSVKSSYSGGELQSGAAKTGVNINNVGGETGVRSIVETDKGTFVQGNSGQWYQQGTDGALTKIDGAQGAGVYNAEGPMGIYSTSNYFVGNFLQGVMWAAMAYGAVQLIGSIFGLEKGLTQSLSYSAAGGLLAYKTAIGLWGKSNGQVGGQGIWGNSLTGTQAALIGLAVAAVIFVMTYKKEKMKMVDYKCMPFEPPLGGSQCEKCNDDPFRPCSEYRCKSLGQSCELLNKGTSHEQCTWISKFDVNSPKITPWNEVLNPGLRYIEDTSIRPPALGVKIIDDSDPEGCLKAFTPLRFGINTSEPAQCKLDYNNPTNNGSLKSGGAFDNLGYYFGGSNYYEYNHSQIMKLPAPDANMSSEAPMLKNDGSYTLYVMCRDGNGNVNEDVYAMSFCVQKAPDTTPPVVESTSIESGSPISFNKDSTNIELYVNEPAECKWSRQDKSYVDMENTMECATETYQINSQLTYTCIGNLTSIKAKESNDFYFRCKDQPDKEEGDRNVNLNSHKLTIRGTKALNIVGNILPNETIRGSTDVVKVNLLVQTDNGAGEGVDQGKATCYFSPNGARDSYVKMFETDSYSHKQSLDLASGSYTYFVRCIDAGGNMAEGNTTFRLEVDKTAPVVTRVYKEGSDALKIVTDEDAQCVYSTTGCNYNFKDGLSFIYTNPDVKTSLFAPWKASTTYYIKCKDKYENEVDSGECNIVASPTYIGSKELKVVGN